MVGRVMATPGRHIFFLLPSFPSLRISTVTMPFSTFFTTDEMLPSANRIFFPGWTDFARSWYEQAMRRLVPK
jgi:hypothetical protein